MIMTHQLTLLDLHEGFAICRLAPKAAIPAWVLSAAFYSITRTADELSIVCPQALVPDDVQCECGWRCFRVAGSIDFAMIGVVATLVNPLAEAGISVFVVSTFDTD